VCDKPVKPGQEVTVMVRPERITVSSSKPEGVRNVGKGTLTKASFMGMYTQLYVDIADVSTKIFSPNQSEAANDWPSRIRQPIYLSWEPQDGSLLLQ
jgi:ABC-type Fe3+/spermidine/putrescine transport system ATPase subunit